jgi:hypothetical protein
MPPASDDAPPGAVIPGITDVRICSVPHGAFFYGNPPRLTSKEELEALQAAEYSVAIDHQLEHQPQLQGLTASGQLHSD